MFPINSVIQGSHVIQVTKILSDKSRGYSSPTWSVCHALPMIVDRTLATITVTYRRPLFAGAHTSRSQAVKTLSCHVWLSL